MHVRLHMYSNVALYNVMERFCVCLLFAGCRGTGCHGTLLAGDEGRGGPTLVASVVGVAFVRV